MSDTTPPRRILKPEQIDDVAKGLLALARELWVTRDRQIAVEAVLAARGIDIAAEVDAFEPDSELQKRLDAERNHLIGAVVTALNGGGH